MQPHSRVRARSHQDNSSMLRSRPAVQPCRPPKTKCSDPDQACCHPYSPHMYSPPLPAVQLCLVSGASMPKRRTRVPLKSSVSPSTTLGKP